MFEALSNLLRFHWPKISTVSDIRTIIPNRNNLNYSTLNINVSYNIGTEKVMCGEVNTSSLVTGMKINIFVNIFQRKNPF